MDTLVNIRDLKTYEEDKKTAMPRRNTQHRLEA
jgi:hypothetical protein